MKRSMLICVETVLYGWIIPGDGVLKIKYAWKEEAMMVIDNLPLPLWVKLIARKIILKLPAETYGEEGPEGPKMKGNWNGDERT